MFNRKKKKKHIKKKKIKKKMQKLPDVIDFDMTQNSVFGSYSDDPFFVVMVTSILIVLGLCICRVLIKPKEALCYENLLDPCKCKAQD